MIIRKIILTALSTQSKQFVTLFSVARNHWDYRWLCLTFGKRLVVFASLKVHFSVIAKAYPWEPSVKTSTLNKLFFLFVSALEACESAVGGLHCKFPLLSVAIDSRIFEIPFS